jgi:crotonobetainyl-CoA:carnitine CoA-transferase CaiB-like acyl-CoA transferase
VIENFGLGWEVVHELNPEAIMVRMPAFGLSGPWRDRTGFAMTIEQATGLAWLTGYPDRQPLVPRGCCDPYGAMIASFATLLALEARSRGEGGHLVEVPLVETGLNAAAEQVAEWSAYGVQLERTANRGPVGAPQGIYACEDGRLVALAVRDDEEWRALLSLLGKPDWAVDPALDTAAGRRAAHDTIDAELARWIATRTVAQITDELWGAGIPIGEVRNTRSLRPHAHLDARGFFRTLEHPAAGAISYPSFPLRFDGEYLPIRRTPPTLGQHNDEVLRDLLGLSNEEIATLREAKIVGERPTFM